MGISATQELAQNVCHRYGWSARFEKEETTTTTDCEESGYWVCYITVGLNDTRKFVSSNHTSPDDTVTGKKEGIAAASQAALEGLKEELIQQEAKPKKELTEAFPINNKVNKNKNKSKNGPGNNDDTNKKNNNNDIDNDNKPLFHIRGSSSRNWEQYIWSKKPAVVGIDTEGNQKSKPPVLIQIATDECVLLEITSMLGNRISTDLQRLLADDSIVKVFCDNFSHHDKKALGILVPVGETTKGKTANGTDNDNGTGDTDTDDNDAALPPFTKGSIIDLEALSSTILGPVKVARGLSRIVNLSMREEFNNVIIYKPPPAKGGRFKNIGRFALIDQGKAPPLKSLRDLSRKEQQYAALDAYATLQAYKHLQAATTCNNV